MVSTVRPLQTLPFQSREDVIWHCMRINDESTCRSKDYREITDLFHAALRNLHHPNDFFVLTRNLSIVQSLVPKDLRESKAVSKRLYEVAFRLSALYLTIMLCCLNNIKTKIASADDLYELDRLKHEIDKVERYNQALPFADFPEWKEVIQQCHSLWFRKAGLLSFTLSVGGQLSVRRTIFPILAIDGGGARGIIPLKILNAMEKITGRPIASLFKLIGGTSTGGIISLGLTKPDVVESWRPHYSAQDMLHIYTHEHDRIFVKNPLSEPPVGSQPMEQIQWRLNNSRYKDPAPFLAEKFGTTLFSSALTDVLVITNLFNQVFTHQKVHYFSKEGLKYVQYRFSDLESRYSSVSSFQAPPVQLSHPFSIQTSLQYDCPMSLAAQATSAAPTFFPLVDWGRDKLMDGGVLQNNPALPCVMEALNRGVRREDILLISLGTGEPPEGFMPEEIGAALFSFWNSIIQPAYKTEFSLNQILKFGAYHRFQHQFENKPPELDDVTPETIQLLENAGDQLVEENYDLLRSICKVLTSESV